ncbi:MAG TPA: UDP-N-acetylmuramoyl-L-alanyl-D-glutamate--2,6-diaminopimelate ligase, partial [Candidatus Saccharimonadales bacterium]|nr:UDP-N-acetylmuramoyl-L-alanyl-D-glutamate--2,6-diaminopimelate ligase [Candidatus Saccharimonadales bacterium]
GIKLAEETYRKSRIYGLQARFGFPAKGLRVIAVTGTNGKTTTCCFINGMLKSAGFTTAMYTTAIIEVNGVAEANKTHRTLPLTQQLLRFLRAAKKAQVDFVILETTSQALHQHKLVGIPVEVAVLTNLSPEHLDYHRTMDNYAAAKARLFNNYMKPDYCVLNADDDRYDYFLMQSVGQVASYGESSDSTERIRSVKSSREGMSWQLMNGNHGLDLHIRLLGLFNVYNASAAASVGLLLGLKPEAITNGLAALRLVPGRMENIDAGQPFTVWVDYAITPDAIAKVLQAGKDAASGSVSLVFGATGDRDKEKRTLMGEAAAKYADHIYLTDDETYTENPEAIRQAVYRGIVDGDGETKTQVIPDRMRAIKTAFKNAKKGDVVILAGLGHQDSRNMGGKLVPWDERGVAKQLLQK